MDRMALIPIMASSAVALATTLWAGAASADATLLLIHDSEDQYLCLNNPYQRGNDNQIVANRNCHFDDAGSVMTITFFDGYTSSSFIDLLNAGRPWSITVNLTFTTNDWDRPYKCLDNSHGAQEDFNPIVVYDCNVNNENQKWDLNSNGELRYHANPAYCANVDADGKLVLYPCKGQGNQRFVIEAKTVTDHGSLGCAIYAGGSKYTGQCTEN